MSNSKTLRVAVRTALITGAALVSAGALAQDQSVVEEITVTGSRIVRQDYNAASPIATVDKDLFEQTGAPTVETVLNTMPQFVPAITTTSNNPSNGGQANVSLRGLGTSRTLILLDGRRMVPSNATGVVDLNLIPASILQSVEIITGGASAVYGSDAIAGVVNFKTRNFTGLELTGNWGQTAESDGKENTMGISYGTELAGGRGYAFGTFSHSKRDEVLQGDRKFSEVALGYDGTDFAPLGSSTIRQGRWDQLTSNLPSQAAIDAYFASVPGYTPGDAGGSFGFNPDGTLFDVSPVINFTGDLNEPQQPVNPASYTYNYAPPNYLQLPLERNSFFGKMGFEIDEATNSEIYAQLLWAGYSADQALAPTPASGMYVNIDNPQIANDTALQTLLASRPDATQPIRIRKRMTDSGPRISNNNYDVIQTTFGAKGDLTAGWSWDAYAQYGNVSQTEKQKGNVSVSAFEELSLADDHGASICGGQGITPFGIGSISPECAAYFTKSAVNSTEITSIIGEATVTGPIFQMPGGEAQAAVGALYKSDDYEFIPDASLIATSTDPVTGSLRTDIQGFNAADVVRGKKFSREVYMEANFPLLSDVPAVKSLEATVGYRYADDSAAGGISSYKAEGIWTVVDAVTVRGGYQRAVRAPNISNLYSPATINFPSITLGDPCSNDFNDPDGNVVGAVDSPAAAALCVAQGIPAASLPAYNYANSQVQGLAGGNPELQEETADTYTLGLVFRSPWEGALSGLQASIDYYQITVEDAVSSIAADTFIQRCFNPEYNPTFDSGNFYCSFFERDAGTGEIVNALEVSTNIAELELTGIDLQVDYAIDVGPGTLDLHWISTFMGSWESAAIRGEPMTDSVGTASFDFDALPEWKWSAGVGYMVAGVDVDLRWRHIDEMTDASFPDFKLDAIDYYDLTLGYTFSGNAMEGLVLRAGVTNLTDEDPIIYPSYQQSNTDPSTYDILGRRYFFSATYNFQ